MPVLDPVLRKDREMKKPLTVDQIAFINAYLNCVAVAERDELVAYLRDDNEDLRAERRLPNYTSIADAHGIWHLALQHARDNKGMTVGKLSAALAVLPQDLPIVIWNAGDRVGIAEVDDSFMYDDEYPRVELNTDRDD